MSRDVCQEKSEESEDISWDVLIADTEEQIRREKDKIKQLAASLRSFKRKKDIGVSLPRAAMRN
jgi:hypothetical protein